MFEVGQQVVCINDDPYFYDKEYLKSIHVENGLDGLTKGLIYTIREIYKSDLLTGKMVTLIKVEEIHRIGLNPKDIDPGYNSERFRPVKKTNIDVFTQILKNVEEVETIEA